MYDTVHIWTEHKKSLSELKNLVDLKSEVRLNTGEEILKGNFRNFSVYQNPNNISLKGSLAKYYFEGSNLETLTRGDTQKAIEKLSDELSLKINTGKITRIDVGTNFIMKEHYRTYFTQLGDLSRFERAFFEGSLYYGNGTKQLVLYEKVTDLENKKIPVPAEIRAYKGRVLRYECRFRKRISKAFNKDIVKAAELYNEDFYMKLIDKWKEYYLGINKLQKLKFKDMALETMNVKLFEADLMLKGIEKIGGIEEALSLVEYSRNKLNRVQVSRLKNKILKLNKTKDLTEPMETIKELDTKVRQAAEQYR